MEVGCPTSSGCFGASERRRETSTMGSKWARAAAQERACGHLNGEWMCLDTDGSMETVHFKRGLVYDGLEEAFLAYVETDVLRSTFANDFMSV